MPTTSAKFARQLQAEFVRESALSSFGEVGQFRALMNAFAGLKPTYFLEEFHGSKRQIYFDTSHPWQRPRARCELCDVLFVVYSTNGGFRVRMTLLQAKLSKEAHVTGSPASAGTIEHQVFKANFEQWNLLCARPPLIPTTVFDPPVDLLSGAQLPSVGTYGVFHQSAIGPVDLFYVSADCLTPDSTPAGPDTRLGKLKTIHGTPARRSIGSWDEVIYCPTSFHFAKSLYEFSIGTPVVSSSSGSRRVEYQPHYNWVRSVLAAHVTATGDNAPVARRLLANLGARGAIPQPDKVPTLIVLQNDAPINRCTDNSYPPIPSLFP